MIDRRKIRIYVRLAAIPQPLAEGFPFQTAHQATPKMAAITVNDAASNRLRRGRKA